MNKCGICGKPLLDDDETASLNGNAAHRVHVACIEGIAASRPRADTSRQKPGLLAPRTRGYDHRPMLGFPSKGSRITAKGDTRVYFIRWREQKEGGGITIKKQEVCRAPSPLNDTTESARIKKLVDAAANAVYARLSPNRVEKQGRTRLPLPDAVGYFLAYATGRKVGEDTEGPIKAAPYSALSVITFRRVLTDFVYYIGENFPDRRKVRALNKEAIDHWREYRATVLRWGKPPKPTTLRTEYSSVQTFLDFAWDRGWLRHRFKVLNPATRRSLGSGARTKLVMEDDQVREVIKAFADNPARHATIYALACLGVRQGELRALEVKDYNQKAGTLTIRGERERTKLHARTLPVPKGLADAISKMLAARKYSGVWLFGKKEGHARLMPGDLNRWLRKHRITPHDFRRWVQHTLDLASCPQIITDYIMGHMGNGTQRAYGHGQVKLSDAAKWITKVDNILQQLP